MMTQGKSDTALLKFHEFIATGCYFGRLRPAPGTWGTGAGVLLYLGALQLHPAFAGTGAMLALAAAVTAIGTYSTHRACKAGLFGGAEDPPAVVVDEVAGYLVAGAGLAGAAFHIPSVILAFITFRLFDIWKPWLIDRAQRLPGAVGIMADDLLAGAAANLVCRMVIWLANPA
jgi:phosphatidylglycerophosphatase A